MVSTKIGNAFIEIIDPKSFAAAVADEIVASINEAISARGRCYLALAGGSTPSAVYRLLSRPPRAKEIPWDQIFFFWGDERWAPHDSAQSNYRMVQETLFNGVKVNAANVFPIDTSLKTVQAAADSYITTINNTVVKDDQGSPKFDIVLLGMGEDGHTASLFPNTTVLANNDVCVVSDRPDGLQAVSLGSSILVRARRVIFMVTGENKAEILQKVLENEISYQLAPASLSHSMSGRVVWFLDTAAAKNIKKPAIASD